jgi:hypothetical protein
LGFGKKIVRIGKTGCRVQNTVISFEGISKYTRQMRYKVVPFVATLQNKGATSLHSAQQLEQLINQYAAQGWDYVRVESVTTFIHGENGCFGFGKTPGVTTAHQMVVFSQS